MSTLPIFTPVKASKGPEEFFPLHLFIHDSLFSRDDWELSEITAVTRPIWFLCISRRLDALRVKGISFTVFSGFVWHERQYSPYALPPCSMKVKAPQHWQPPLTQRPWFIADFTVGMLPVESSAPLFDEHKFPLDFLFSNVAATQTCFACEIWHHLSLRLYVGRKMTSLIHVSIFFPFHIWQQQDHMMECCT